MKYHLNERWEGHLYLPLFSSRWPNCSRNDFGQFSDCGNWMRLNSFHSPVANIISTYLLSDILSDSLAFEVILMQRMSTYFVRGTYLCRCDWSSVWLNWILPNKKYVSNCVQKSYLIQARAQCQKESPQIECSKSHDYFFAKQFIRLQKRDTNHYILLSHVTILNQSYCMYFSYAKIRFTALSPVKTGTSHT